MEMLRGDWKAKGSCEQQPVSPHENGSCNPIRATDAGVAVWLSVYLSIDLLGPSDPLFSQMPLSPGMLIQRSFCDVSLYMRLC